MTAKLKWGVLFIAVLLLMILNYVLWLNGMQQKKHIKGLEEQVSLHESENQQLNDRNSALLTDVHNLRSPEAYAAYEEKARENYGFIGQNETFFVLPDAELDKYPNVPGLKDEQPGIVNPDDKDGIALESLDNSSVKKQGSVPSDTIPVAPIPLQLESLQE